jgi:hypothetical protein
MIRFFDLTFCHWFIYSVKNVILVLNSRYSSVYKCQLLCQQIHSNPLTFNGAFRFTNVCIIQQYLTNYIFQVSWIVHFYQVFQTSVFGLVYTWIFRHVWMNMIGGFCRKRLAQPPSLSSMPQSSLWTFDTQLCLKGK